MKQKFKPALPKCWLLLMAGVVWSAVGIGLNILAFKWLGQYSRTVAYSTALSGMVAGLLSGTLGFSRIVKKNIQRISGLPETPCAFAFQEVKSYFLIVFMIALGSFLRHSALVPRFILSFIYITIGLSLFVASLKYYRSFYLWCISST